jgi:hypothetical protein
MVEFGKNATVPEDSAKPVSTPAEIPPHTHVLFLANGTQVYYDAPADNPHGPVPTEVNGVPVVNHVHAFGG